MHCVQITKLKCKKLREIGVGYIIRYLGNMSTRNGIGVIVNDKMEISVVEVIRKSGKVIIVKCESNIRK